MRYASRYYPVVLVTGQRQVGKSTMLNHIKEPERTYVTLDDANARRLAETDLQLFFETYGTLLLIDEVQRVPSLLLEIKNLIDEKTRNGQECNDTAYRCSECETIERIFTIFCNDRCNDRRYRCIFYSNVVIFGLLKDGSRMQESASLELKQEISNTFLKTVSAFANYRDGRIIFGVTDDGEVKGIDNINDERLRIDRMISDSIRPVPTYSIETEQYNSKEVLILHVSKGIETPYLWKGKAYRRSDTSTSEVDVHELRRLVAFSKPLDYEQKIASSQTLQFEVLESHLKSATGIEVLTLDILKTLHLFTNLEGYNTAAEIFADSNTLQFLGIDIARFGETENLILHRETISQKSILLQYEQAIQLFEQYYQYEEIVDYSRVRKSKIPKEAFREALANALVHRALDIRSLIQISMYDTRIEISSPGGLPPGLSEDEYLYGTISILRNPIIANIFYRLKLIEQFGTGIARIVRAYEESLYKPSFKISDGRVIIILPTTICVSGDFSEDELQVLALFREHTELSRQEIERATSFNKPKVLRIMTRLLEHTAIKRIGSGPEVRYRSM